MDAGTPISDKQSEAILSGSVTRGVMLFGLPMVAAMALHGGFNLVDAFFVGQLPDAAAPLAAIGICDPVLMVAMIFANGIATASVALIARAKGAGRDDEVRAAAGQSLLIVALVSLFFGVVGFVFAPQIGMGMGAQGAVLELVTDYLRLMFAGSFTMIFLLQLTAIQRGVGDSKGPTAVLITANLLNIIADPFLMYGWAGIPALGLMGAAWATVGARAVGCVLALALCLKFQRNSWPQPHHWLPKWAMIKRILKLGLPNSGQLVIRVLAMLAIVALVTHVFTTPDNPSATAALAIGIRIDMVAIFAAMGWGAAASTYVGQNLGARKVRRAVRSGWVTCLLATGFMIIVTGLVQVFAEPLVRVFAGQEAEVVRIGVEYLRIVSLSYPLAAAGIVLALALNGAGSTRVPALIDLLVYALLMVPAAYLLVYAAGMGRISVWVVLASTNAVLAIAYALWFRRGGWYRMTL